MGENDVIRLIHYTTETDEYGDTHTIPVSREVFAECLSIGQSEFYQAAATGLRPELCFKLSDYYDYDGEQIVEHDGNRYRVLRTYRSGQELELTVYQEANPA